MRGTETTTVHWPRLAALALFSAALGSMHAFSVLLAPLEERLSVGRGRVSLIYGAGLLTLTFAVRVSGDWPARWRHSSNLPILVGAAAGSGLLLAAATSSYVLTFAGYALIFGAANGIGYGTALEAAGLCAGHRSGMAMALATASYAIGATVAAVFMEIIVDQFGAATALAMLAAAIVLVSGITTLVLRTTVSPAVREPDKLPLATTPPTARAWWAYGLSVIAGLMALGHAAEIMRLAGASADGRQLGVVLLTIASAAGGVLIALVVLTQEPWRLLVGLPLVSGAGLLILASDPGVSTTIAGLTTVGVTYGAIIALYPVAVMKLAGPHAYAATYARVFTAWGIAGLAGPFVAGVIFDQRGSYRLALLLAAVAAAGSAVIAYPLNGSRSSH